MKIPEKLQLACSEGQEFIKGHNTLKDAWENCNNPSWMFWAIRQLKYDNHKQFILLSCKIACDTPLADGQYTYELLTDKISRDAIEAAIMYAHGKITLEDMKVFANAASAAASAVICDMIREFISWEDIEKLL
jgi:hypothetical protein